MNANRPRHSVLCLFDPLAASNNDLPSTPPRESSDSDKENNHLSLSVFFNRTYKQHSSSLLVSPPRKHLVDIGDSTLENSSTIDLLGEGQEPLQQQIDSDIEQSRQQTPHLRAPFAELLPGDPDATPLARLRAHPHQSHMPPLPPLMSNEEQLSPSHDSPLTNRMSQVTMCNADDIIVPYPVEEGRAEAPRIVISCSSVNNSPDKMSRPGFPDNVTTTLTDSLLDQKERLSENDPHPTLHLRAPKPALHDTNRFSIDLQASFQMYLQSDTSFDLLNDKISLIDPMECLTTDDEHFDFELEKDKLQDAMAKFKRGPKIQYNASPGSPPESSASLLQDSTESNAPCDQTPGKVGDVIPSHDPCDPPASPSNSLQCVPSSPLGDFLDRPNKRWSTNSGIPSPTSYRAIKETPSATDERVLSAIPQSKQRRMSSPLTPQRVLGVVPPPAVQALRIVKRAKVKPEPRDDACPSASNTIVTLTMRDTGRPQARKETPRSAAEVSLPETRPLRVEPPPARHAPVKQARTFTSISCAGAGLGPRRVPISDNRAEPMASKSNPMSLPGSAPGPRRMQISSTGTNMPSSKTSSIPSGLKQPTRLAATTSNLPRPSGMATTSRLPAPIGEQHMLRRVTGTSKGNLPRRVVSGD